MAANPNRDPAAIAIARGALEEFPADPVSLDRIGLLYGYSRLYSVLALVVEEFDGGRL